MSTQSTPTAARVAKPKTVPKAARMKKNIAARVAKSESSQKAIPYNGRIRSLLRAFVTAIPDKSEKKRAREAVKQLIKFEDVRTTIIDLSSEEQFCELLNFWFNAGAPKDSENV